MLYKHTPLTSIKHKKERRKNIYIYFFNPKLDFLQLINIEYSKVEILKQISDALIYLFHIDPKI